eukprot:scaffold39054_cov27-Tisochrysis_lutea.AAC.1
MKRDSHLETSAVLKVRRLTLLWTHAPPPHLVHGVVFCLSPFLQILFSTPPTHTYAHTSRTLHAPQLLQWWWSARSNCAPLQGGAHGVDGGAACAASWGAPNPSLQGIYIYIAHTQPVAWLTATTFIGTCLAVFAGLRM